MPEHIKQQVGIVNFLFLGMYFSGIRTQKPVYIEQPHFKFLEKSDLQIRYKKSLVMGLQRTLHFCCVKTALPSKYNFQCLHRSKCPNFEEGRKCHERGRDVLCLIKYVMPDEMYKAQVFQHDENNVTLASNIATYVTNDTVRHPRAVNNVSVTAQGKNFLLQWEPSNLDDLLDNPDSYSQLIVCQPTKNKLAKRVRQQIDIQSSTLVVPASNITAVTEYQCCVQVENNLSSQPSDAVCQNITSPEQAPSAAPLITCGDNVTCEYRLDGDVRNVTITFKLPNATKSNGKIIYSVIRYRNVSSVNSTFRTMFVNGTSTMAHLQLNNDQVYLVYMKTATKAGLSPKSNTVQIEALRSVLYDPFPTVKVVTSVVSTFATVAIILLIMYALLKRAQRLARREKLPDLDLSRNHGYENAEGSEVKDTYDKLGDDSSELVNTHEGMVSVLNIENPVFDEN